MPNYTYINFLIGNEKFAMNAQRVYRFLKNNYEQLPYPGKNKKFGSIISSKIGSIPILDEKVIKAKVNKGNYIIILQVNEKKIGILVDEIFDITEDLDSDVKLIDLDKILWD